MNKKVLIIGAGVSGYAAGCRLLEKGFKNIIILEAQDRIGGRIHSVKFGDSKVDLGAQWCHGEKDNIVFDMVKNFNLLQPSFNNYAEYKFVDPNGKFVSDEVSAALTGIAYSLHDDEEMGRETGSFGDFFIKRYNEEVRNAGIDKTTALNVQEWFHKFFNSINASSSWFDVSAKGLTQYKECEGDLTLNWKGTGYETIFKVLKKTIPDPNEELPIDSKIQFNKEVSKIIWDSKQSDNVIVNCTDGTKYEANYLIVTVSLSFLKENYKTLFVPELPLSKQNAIKYLGIGTVNKIFLRFKKPWWPVDAKGFCFIWPKNDNSLQNEDLSQFGDLKSEDGKSWIQSIFGFYRIDDNPNILMGWVVGPLGPQIEKISDEIVLKASLFLLNKFLGRHYKIGEVTEILRSKWYSNKFIRGSYSYRTLETEQYDTSAEALSIPLVSNGKEKVLFAGEATHSCYYSTVHGAIESGFREADRVLKLCSVPSKCKVAIIGAGISGISAAKTLIESGITDILMLEAQSKIGGRIDTLKLENGQIDLGAQWLHGKENELFKISEKNGLLSPKMVDEGQGLFLREDGVIFDKFLVNKVNFLIGQILEECEEFMDKGEYPESIGEYLRVKFGEYLTCNGIIGDELTKFMEVYDWNVRFQIIDNSCESLNELSAKVWGEYSCDDEEDYGQNHISYSKGYSSVLDVLTQDFPENIIQLNYPIDHIDWNQSPIVITSRKRVFRCDHLIVTCPLGVLKSTNLFSPNLPEKLNKTISSMGFKGIAKIFLEFPINWWGSLEGIQLLFHWNNPYGNDWTRYLSGFDMVHGQPNMLLGWVGGKGAEIVEQIPESDIGITCTNLLRKFLKKDNIPFPKKIYRTKWNSNPYIRGGYSHGAAACDAEDLGPRDFLLPILDDEKNIKILFAGEHCSVEHFSTVHGAYETGQKQALVLLKHLQRKTK